MTQWDNYRRSLRQHFETDEIDNFLQWSTVQATMFVGNAPYIDREYDCLLGCNHHYRWERAIKETWVGNPTPFNHFTSGNLIHQAYHLKQWLDRTRQKLSEIVTIVEVGAGYGAMALIARRLGFAGQYVIFDLPELVTIQQYYLDRNGIMAIWAELLANGLATASLSCDLFIASHSLGEMPITERERLLSQVAAREYLFASSYEYEGVDNQKWFQQFAGMMGRDWVFYPHKYQENAFYMVGVEL